MMKTLIVTGQLAKHAVELYVKDSSVKTEIVALPVSVAALLTPQRIAQELKETNLLKCSLILVPGLIRGDVSVIEQVLDIPTVKGPKYSADLPIILDQIEQVRFSSTVPADELVFDSIKEKALTELQVSKEQRKLLLKKPGNYQVNSVAFGRDFPLRIMAEISHAPTLSDDDIFKKIEYFLDSGADIIDIGTIAGESRPKDVFRIIDLIHKSFDVPISIDTFDLKEVEAGAQAGADILLSADQGNIMAIAEVASEMFVIITPTNQQKGYFPNNAWQRVRVLEDTIQRAKNQGISKIIADPLLNPLHSPGTIESLVAYYTFSKRNPDIPLLFGTGNVTELIDADSIGVNALLTGLASELDVDILLTTEESNKTKGSVRELAKASQMMFVAKKRHSVPKDMGLNLLIFKEKRMKEDPYHKGDHELKSIVLAKPVEDITIDEKRFFRILVDRENRKLVAIHHENEKANKVVKGETAQSIISTIVDLNLISSLHHAAYLGRELEKAEIALKIGKTYIQDLPLF